MAPGGFKRIRRVGVIVSITLLALPALAAATPDTPATADWLLPADLTWTGDRVAAKDVQSGATISGVIIPTAVDNDAGDPPLVRPASPLGAISNCRPRDDMTEFGRRSVWYRLVGDPNGLPLPERMQVTIDAVGTSSGNAIAIYERSPGAGPPAAWKTGDPAPDVVACNKANVGLLTVAAFVAYPAEHDYYVEVTQTTAGGAGQLTMNVRVLDVQPPQVVISTDRSFAEPKKTTDVTIDRSDNGSRLAAQLPTVTVTQAGHPLPFEQVATSCPSSPKPAPGHFCLRGSGNSVTAEITWFGVAGSLAEAGIVKVADADNVGNLARAAVTLSVRHSFRPRAHARILRVSKHTARLIGWCGEPDPSHRSRDLLTGPRRAMTLTFQLFDQTGRRVQMKKRSTFPVKTQHHQPYVATRLKTGAYSVVVTCEDNLTQTVNYAVAFAAIF
jgi:hypothetical protein